jgi:hypothetical protein
MTDGDPQVELPSQGRIGDLLSSTQQALAAGPSEIAPFRARGRAPLPPLSAG